MMTSEELDAFLAGPPPKRKPPEPAKCEAEVIPLPQGQALAVAKSERTKADAISRALGREKLREQERQRRAEAYLKSETYNQAGLRFNREHYFRDPNADGPCHFQNPGGWA